ncbi:MAG: hypothetical protein L6282_13050 [Candidatus Methanoperedenaceae archaeon]|nr:hypothetical protein [Candidatus Methanoperedenaceae archaeon]
MKSIANTITMGMMKITMEFNVTPCEYISCTGIRFMPDVFIDSNKTTAAARIIKDTANEAIMTFLSFI